MKAEETTLNFQLRSSLRLLLTRLINHPSSRDSLSFFASPSLLSLCTSVSSCDSIISWKENLIYSENPERIQRTEKRRRRKEEEQNRGKRKQQQNSQPMMTKIPEQNLQHYSSGQRLKLQVIFSIMCPS